MPGLWAAVGRGAMTAGAVALPMLTAAAVVAGSLWLAITPGDQTLKLSSEAARGVTLEDVRPSDTGNVNPKLATAVDTILARRGVAVRANNLALFLWDVSPALKAQQRQLFTNMRTLQMAVTFRRAEPWQNYQALRRFGPATGTFRVSMRYELRGTKVQQAATDLGYTFTVRSGRLYLVDDSDLDKQLGAGVQPWDFGPIQVVRRKNVLVIVNAGQLARAQQLADETVKMARRVRKLWQGRLQQVPVVVAMAEPRVLVGMPPIFAADGPAVVQPMPSPAIDGWPVGGWVVIKPAARLSLDDIQMTHVLMHLLPVRLGPGAPRWLAEGLAEYAENRQLAFDGRLAEVNQKRKAVSKALGNLSELPSDDSFGNTDSYSISWLAVEHLIKKIGFKRVTDYYLQVARRGYNPALRERMLEEQTGFTEKQLVDSLRSLAG